MVTSPPASEQFDLFTYSLPTKILIHPMASGIGPMLHGKYTKGVLIERAEFEKHRGVLEALRVSRKPLEEVLLQSTREESEYTYMSNCTIQTFYNNPPGQKILGIEYNTHVHYYMGPVVPTGKERYERPKAVPTVTLAIAYEGHNTWFAPKLPLNEYLVIGSFDRAAPQKRP
jgi:hypothetical protein